MTMMPTASETLSFLGGAGLLALGAIVLGTAVLMSRPGPVGRGRVFGGLMLLYGVLMLAIAGAMLAQVFPMMEGALYSGIAMIVLGVAMLISGGTMPRSGRPMA